jgi:hypothetical protein
VGIFFLACVSFFSAAFFASSSGVVIAASRFSFSFFSRASTSTARSFRSFSESSRLSVVVSMASFSTPGTE